MKMIVKKAILSVSLVFVFISAFAQQISPYFFGQNAWMPDTIGDVVLNGALHKSWNAIKHSGTSLIRFGGIAPDRSMPTNFQYIKMIDSVRANGMEPMIQVPFHNNKYSAQQAAEIVKFLNVTNKKNIKYWVIGNEPDLEYGYTSSTQVATYLKAFASAMKAVDPSILTIGPETAWFNEKIIKGLTTPGGPDDITGKDASGKFYIDIISFHTYPFNGSQSRQQVISKLTEANSLQQNLAELNARIAACNTYHNRTGSATLKMAITEANINYVNNENDNLYGSGANSFIGGQFIAEMLGIAMKNNVTCVNLWSVIEGQNTAYNIGFLDRERGKKKPLYYHYQMMAKNFRGTYCDGTDNQNNVKAFGCKDAGQVAVMILNQDEAASHKYTVRLNTAKIENSSALKVNIDAQLSKEYSDVISSQSSLVLIFDENGNIVRKIEYKLAGNADKGSEPTVVDIGNPTGNEELASAPIKGTRTYPNPTNGTFTFEGSIKNPLQEEVDILVFNTVGQLVYTRKPAVENGYIKEKVELNPGIATGVYIVQLKVGDKVSNTKMMVTR